MKLIFYEIHKVFSKPLIIITFLVIFLINGIITLNVSNESRQIEDLYDKISDMSNASKLIYLKDCLDEFENLVYQDFSFSINESTNFSNDNYITADIISEMQLYETVYHEVYAALNYDLFINDIINFAKNIDDFAIFADENSFDYKNAQLAASEYKKLENKSLTIQSSQGIIQALSNPFSIFAMLLIAVLFTVNLVCEDIESGCEAIVKSTKNGRDKTAFVRLLLISLFCVFSSILILGSNFLISHFVLGLGDLSVSIQSISTFYSSWLDVTVLEYIFILLFTNIFTMILTSLLTFFICRKFANSMISYFVVIAILVLEYLAYVLISQNSYLNILKFVNVFSLMDLGEVVSYFKSLNVFSNPVNILFVQFMFLIFMIVLLTTFIVIESKRTCNKQNLKYTLSLRRKKSYTYSLFINEMYKHLISGKVIYVAIALIIYAGYTVHFYHSEYNRTNNLYKAYIYEVEGMINEETQDFIEAEQAKFDEMDNTLLEYGIKYEAGQITEEEYFSLNSAISNWNEHRDAFNIFKAEIALLQNDGIDMIIYRTGYDRIFGYTALTDFYRLNAFGMTFLLFSISSFYATDNRKGMSKLISPTVKGRKNLMLVKISITVIISIFVAFFSFVPHIVKTLEIYGSEQLASDINYLISFPIHISILEYIVILFAFYATFYTIVGVIMLFISKNSKRNIVSLSISSILFVIPSLLLMLS